MLKSSRAKVLRNLSPLLVVPALLGVGCGRQQPVNMAPPVGNAPVVNTAPPITNASQQGAVPTGDNVFDWHDVPANQQVPITRGVFDQSGYQLFAASGETIVVPFANQNMYVMRFGKSTNGGMYFTSDGAIPTLYVPNGGYLENSVAQGARWFPFPQNYAYTQPVYLGIAPSWSAYTGMGWYPGMSYYGGYWSAHPYGYGGGFSPFAPMVGLNFIIGGRPYNSWGSYQNYYRYNPSSAVRMRTVYNYNSVRRNSPSAFGNRNTAASSGRRFGNSSGSTGSFGSGRRSGSGSTGSTGSFGNSRRFGSGSSGTGSTGSFGGSNSSRRPFGSGSGGTLSGPRSTGSFGSGSSSGYSSSTRRGTGSFGSGSSSGYGGSFGSSSRRSFGSGSSSGSSSSSPSFGSSSRRSSGSSFGGSSFGGSRRSSGGGSFGRRR
jgi:hypothetical protein